MKTVITFLLGLTMATPSFGQFQAYVMSLKTSEEGIHLVEIQLGHRDHADPQKYSSLGTRTTLIPSEFQGQTLKMEYRRFYTHVGSAYEMDSATYVRVSLGYDMETADPRDDLFLFALPFKVDKDLVLAELSYYDGETLFTPQFKDAPQGASTQKIIPLQRLDNE